MEVAEEDMEIQEETYVHTPWAINSFSNKTSLSHDLGFEALIVFAWYHPRELFF